MYIRLNCAPVECELLDDIDTTYKCFKALETYHLDEGPVKQVNLIQNALAQRVAHDKDQVSNCWKIREDIRRAFDMPGGIMAETFINITLLIVLGCGHEHLHAMIQHDMQAATAGVPFKSEQIMLYLEQDLQLLLGDEQCSGTADAVALAAQSSQKRGTRSSPECSNCHQTGHTADFCVRTGGGMAGKSIEEAQAAKRRGSREKQEKPKDSKNARPKVALSFKDSNGQAFITHVDTDNITAMNTNTATSSTVHANLASVNFNSPSLNLAAHLTGVETVEYEGFLVCFDDPRVSIDWAEHSNNIEVSPTMIAAPHQTRRTAVISLDTCPFFLDSGASVHVSPEQSDFLSLRPISSKAIKGVGGSSILATRIGDIKLCIARGAYIILLGVLFIPNSTVHLISISSLTRDSTCHVHFGETSCWIDNSSTKALIAHGSLTPSKGLYTLDLHSPQAEHTLTASSDSASIETWHCHLGHANYQTLKDMARNRLIEGMPTTFSTAPDCDSCIIGKQTKTPVPKKREEGPGHRATRKLEKVWVDLIGPISVTSANGNRYVMDLLDDYTSKGWSIPLKSKDQAFPELQAWELAREKETGFTVGTYRVDNGELKSKKMEAWLKSRGVQQNFTAPYTSAHIGHIERMHRTLMAKARTMRIYAGCLPELWDEFYVTANHLQDKMTTHSLPGTTPWQEYYGRKPDYSYMREIGCKAFALIQNKHNPKLYGRSLECILIGYNENAKSYRLYNPETRKVYSTYHVRFLESKDGHAHTLSQTQSLPTTSQTLPPINDTVTMPILFDPMEDDEFIPPTELPPEPNIPDHVPVPQPDPAPQPNPAPGPVPDVSFRRSSRIASTRNGLAAGVPKLTAVECAIMESKASAERRAIEKEERRRQMRETRIEEVTEEEVRMEEERPMHETTTVEELEQLLTKLKLTETPSSNITEAVLSALGDTEGIDPCIGLDDEPRTWKEAQASSEAKEWKKGYLDELKSLKDMGVYKLVPQSSVPAGAKIRKGCPVFTRKRDENGNVVRHKVRLVFKGFEQIYGKDYTTTTSPTACMESWRILLHLAATLNWSTKQTDVKTAFLYSILPNEEVQWMEQPEGMEEEGFEDYVWMLQRGLYGMKQAGCLWNKTMDAAMVEWGFTCLSSESCIYYRQNEQGIVIAVVHVDDFLSVANSEEENARFEAQMKTKWITSSLREPKFCIGIAIKCNRTDRTVSLSQTALIDRIVTQFGQGEAHPISTPMDPGLKLRRPAPNSITPLEREKLSKIPYRSLVGCLIYLAVGTRFDISYAVQQLSQFLDCYTHAHWNAAI